MSPALIFYGFEKLGRTPRGKMTKMLYEVGVFTFSLMFALPSSIALFPQTGRMTASQIEEHLKQDRDGRTVSEVYYNKGL